MGNGWEMGWNFKKIGWKLEKVISMKYGTVTYEEYYQSPKVQTGPQPPDKCFSLLWCTWIASISICSCCFLSE